MKRDAIAIFLILATAGYATWSILTTTYASTQVIEIKQDFMRPCDICPRKYRND